MISYIIGRQSRFRDESMADPVVRFSKVSKSFGSAAVLREIDFALPAGQFLGLAGLNGAGKTTLIKCLLDF